MKQVRTRIVKYERKVRNSKLQKEDSQYSPLHQPSGRCLKRLKKKAQARETWFRGDRDKGKDGKLAERAFQKAGKSGMKSKILASTVMFIPSTKNGILLKMMKENEEKLVEMTGFRVSYAESGGTQLGRYFSTNLATGRPCGRESNKCIPCNRMDTKLQNCKARSIVYESSCEVCNPPSIEQGGSSPEEDKHHQEPRKTGE